MKILCTKEEYKDIVLKCARAIKESDCQACMFRSECDWDIEYLASKCEIVPEIEAQV